MEPAVGSIFIQYLLAQKGFMRKKGTTPLFCPFADQEVKSINVTIQEATINHLTFCKITLKRKK